MEVVVEGTGVRATNVLDLKNPFFRYTGIQTVPPPGNHTQSPTDAYWGNAGVVLNGGVLSSSSGGYGGTQVSGNYSAGGGLFAYSSQAVGNVMATGTGSYSNQAMPSISSAGNHSRYSPVSSSQNYGMYQSGYH
eukprot:Seg2695.5 transcript_id=Seg2695.5/GoldUCD/mRNA.D3Y31 product="Histone-arginine methyltransferase CARMER" protein_id=Seg2695.5/GoldUCD/D3Y31